MESPVVETNLGLVKGVAIPKANHEEAKQVYAYMGIPFAKPPLGNLRFKAPQKPEPWCGVLDASKGPNTPMAGISLTQGMVPYVPVSILENEEFGKISEDCLYLNVYTSNLDKAAKLPVLFWLYGGGFTIGGAVGYNGQALCGLNDVVLVVPQYRVNVFGFYSLGKESSCPGNMGLQDQIMAMEWVRDNISNFGGDSGNVTLFGQSAGAVSVSFHVLSPKSRGLFHRAISHSGTATLPMLINADLSAQRKLLHEELNITATDPEEILKQLGQIDAKTIIKAIDADDYRKIMFTPTVDGEVLPKHPTEMIREGNFAHVPYMLGVNSTEGRGILSMDLPPTFGKGLDNETCINAVKAWLASTIPPEKLDDVTDLIIETLGKEFDKEDQYKWSKIVGNYNILMGMPCSLSFFRAVAAYFTFSPEPWCGVLDASKGPDTPMAGISLTQGMLPYVPVSILENEEFGKISEDCLYLNVYTSNLDKAAKLPVLFWLYGGGFTIGGAVGYNGQALCGLNDVVLVVPQYRVNVFGFYSLGKESSCKGNMGLQDQIMAMEWVRDNISNFGGDSGNVTLFGQSAGAVSVSFHVLSPKSRGLFHRAISHSGTATLPMLINADLSAQRKLLHEELNITATDPEEILKQLGQIDAKTIIKAIDADDYRKIMFTPSVDGEVLPKHPTEMIREGNFAHVPYMLGVNSTEGRGILSMDLPPTFGKGLDNETCINAVKAWLASTIPPEKLDDVTDLIIETLGKEFDKEDQYKWSKIVGNVFEDTMFIAPSIGQAMAHSGAGFPTYVYYMTHQTKIHHDEDYSGNIKIKSSICEADHSDDVLFTMGYPFLNSKFTLEGFKFSDDEKLLSTQWMKTLCTFAKYGNPNSDDDVEHWPAYDCEKKRHLIMKIPYDVGSNLLAKRCKLWLETIPRILSNDEPLAV